MMNVCIVIQGFWFWWFRTYKTKITGCKNSKD